MKHRQVLGGREGKDSIKKSDHWSRCHDYFALPLLLYFFLEYV